MSNNSDDENAATHQTENCNTVIDMPAITAEELSQRKPFIRATTRVTILISLMYCIMYLDRVNMSMAAKAMMKEFGWSNTQLGFAFSAFFWPYLIGQLFGGWFVKQIGARKTLILLASLVAVTTVATGFINGLMALIAVRFGLGCGEGPAWSAATSAMSDWYSVKSFGFIQGFTHSAARLGMAIAPPIVAWAMVISGWRSAFWFCGMLSAVWVVGWWYFYRDNPRTHPLITAKELSELPLALKATKKTKVPIAALARRIAPVTACQFCYGWGLWLFVSWLPLYFMNAQGVNLKSSALLSGLTFGAGFVGDWLGGVISDKICTTTGNKLLARNVFICVCMIASAVTLFLTMHTKVLVSVVGLVAASFFFLELTVGAMWACPMDISRDFAGIGAGMMNFGAGLSGVMSPPIIGYIIDKTGSWNNALWCSIGVLVMGAVLTIFMRPDKPFVMAD